MLKNCYFHHIGKAVASVSEAAQYYSDAGYSVSEPIIEPVQKVIVVYARREGFPTVELLEPLNETSPVRNILAKSGNGVLYHVCYAVENIGEAINDLKKRGFLPLGKPVPGKGLDNALTVFLFNKTVGLIQLAEMQRK